MDDALVLLEKYYVNLKGLVLILVVMDDALVRLCDVNGHYYAEKS